MRNQSDRQWAMAIVGRTMKRLRAYYVAAGEGEAFEVLQEHLTRGPISGEYDEIGAKIQMHRDAVAIAVSRLRRTFEELLCEELRRSAEGNGNPNDAAKTDKRGGSQPATTLGDP